MIDWFVNILRTYPELAVFLAIGIGFLVGPWKFMGFSLGLGHRYAAGGGCDRSGTY